MELSNVFFIIIVNWEDKLYLKWSESSRCSILSVHLDLEEAREAKKKYRDTYESDSRNSREVLGRLELNYVGTFRKKTTHYIVPASELLFFIGTNSF